MCPFTLNVLQKRVRKKMKSINGTLTWWVGLQKSSRGLWRWSDDGDLNYRITRWKPRGSDGTRAKCAELNSFSQVNDLACEEARPFICEQHAITPRPVDSTTQPITTTTSSSSSSSSSAAAAAAAAAAEEEKFPVIHRTVDSTILPITTTSSSSSSTSAAAEEEEIFAVTPRTVDLTILPITTTSSSSSSSSTAAEQTFLVGVHTDCEKGRYGDQCSHTCGHCLNSDTCDVINGHCPGGCEEGFGGPRCDSTIVFVDDFQALYLAVGISSAVVAALLIVIVCLACRLKRAHQRAVGGTGSEGGRLSGNLQHPETGTNLQASPWEDRTAQGKSNNNTSSGSSNPIKSSSNNNATSNLSRSARDGAILEVTQSDAAVNVAVIFASPPPPPPPPPPSREGGRWEGSEGTSVRGREERAGQPQSLRNIEEDHEGVVDRDKGPGGNVSRAADLPGDLGIVRVPDSTYLTPVSPSSDYDGVLHVDDPRNVHLNATGERRAPALGVEGFRNLNAGHGTEGVPDLRAPAVARDAGDPKTIRVPEDNYLTLIASPSDAGALLGDNPGNLVNADHETDSITDFQAPTVPRDAGDPESIRVREDTYLTPIASPSDYRALLGDDPGNEPLNSAVGGRTSTHGREAAYKNPNVDTAASPPVSRSLLPTLASFQPGPEPTTEGAAQASFPSFELASIFSPHSADHTSAEGLYEEIEFPDHVLDDYDEPMVYVDCGEDPHLYDKVKCSSSGDAYVNRQSTEL